MFPWLDSDVKCVEGEKQRVLGCYRRRLDMYGSQVEFIRPNLSHKPPEYHTEKIMLHKIGICSGFPSNTVLEYTQKRDKIRGPHSVFLHGTFTKY